MKFIRNLISLICELMEFDGQIVYQIKRKRTLNPRADGTATLPFALSPADFKVMNEKITSPDWYREQSPPRFSIR